MTIIRTHDWNGNTYTVVENDNGNRVEIKGPIDTALAKAAEIFSLPTPVVSPIELSDAQLLAEVSRRNLVLRIRGEAI